jgi:hypothetical protein
MKGYYNIYSQNNFKLNYFAAVSFKNCAFG